MVKAPRSLLRIIASTMDVLQNLPRLMKIITSAMAADHHMDRLWTRNPHHIANVFIQPPRK
jgi:hypothetical protein